MCLRAFMCSPRIDLSLALSVKMCIFIHSKFIRINFVLIHRRFKLDSFFPPLWIYGCNKRSYMPARRTDYFMKNMVLGDKSTASDGQQLCMKIRE